jgi:hypothetical protein
LIVGNQGVAQCDRLSSYEQVVAAKGFASLFKPSADQSVGCVGRRLEWENVHCAKQRFDLLRKTWRSFSGGAISQFRSDDDAGTDLLFANFSCMFRYPALWISDPASLIGLCLSICQSSSLLSSAGSGSLPVPLASRRQITAPISLDIP